MLTITGLMNTIIDQYCTPEWQAFVRFHSKVTGFKKGETIFHIGDRTEGLYIILTGKVKILTSNGANQNRIIRLAADGDIFGHRGFGSDWTYTIEAIVLSDTDVLFVPLDIFNQAVKANPEFGFYMMMFFAEELRDSENLAKQLPVRNLVAAALYANYKAFGLAEGSRTRLSYTLSRKELASKAGTTYETVVRSLAGLHREGVIKIDGKSIHILKPKILENMSRSG